MNLTDKIINEIENRQQFSVQLKDEFIKVVSGLYENENIIVEQKFLNTENEDLLYNTNFYFNISKPKKMIKDIRLYYIRKFKNEYK